MSAQEKREIKVLKYIKKHQPVTKKQLYSKFPFLESDFRFISEYVTINGTEYLTDSSGYDTGEWVVVETSTYTLNRNGRIFFEKQREKFWAFWLPYGITTIIAISSLIINIIGIIKQ